MDPIPEGKTMQIPSIRMFIAFAILLCSGCVWAQGKVEREIEIHKNIKLIELAPASDISEDLVKLYKEFLPKFEEVLKKNTVSQPDECSLTLRIFAGAKAIGAAKIERPTAHVTAFRKNSKEEYIGNLILYSYVSNGAVDEQEITRFLKNKILEPAECTKPH
jgi:hypothetical protein